MRVAITGGTGFIGGHPARRLVSERRDGKRILLEAEEKRFVDDVRPVGRREGRRRRR